MGAEGPTDETRINNLRERQTRNFLATLMLSQGVPMLAGGDEFARSQMGNNNCYCQDNELTWYDWKLDEPRKRLLEFTSQADRISAKTIQTCIAASSFRTGVEYTLPRISERETRGAR
jgi:pullulanase/glycogen debranching enzyme